MAYNPGVDAGVGKDAGGGLLGGVGGVLFVVDGDAGEQGAVEYASFGWFALVVEVDEEFGELVQACSGVGVGVGEVVELCGDLVEAGADAVLFAFEEVEGDRVGVVGLDEFEAFGFELVALGGQGSSSLDPSSWSKTSLRTFRTCSAWAGLRELRW